MSGMPQRAWESPVEVFCSYAPEDERWMRELEKHLALLSREGCIALWNRRKLTGGTNWQQIIDNQIESATLILLLISADFLSSDYCSGCEMECALQRDEEGSAKVIPVLIRKVDWEGAPFAHLEPLPANRCPVASWQNQDEAFAEIVQGLRLVLKELPMSVVPTASIDGPACWNVPYARNPVFTGREELLTRLEDSLKRGKAAALTQPGPSQSPPATF